MVGVTKLGTLICSLPFLIACSEGKGIAEGARAAPPQDVIEEQLNLKLRTLHPNYPDARVVQLRIAPDGIIACGWAASSGGAPILFISTDKTPWTPEDRSIALSRITTEDGWGANPFPASDQMARDVCTQNGLMTPRPG